MVPAPSPAPDASETRLRCATRPRLFLRGPHSGRAYGFTLEGDTPVDPRDVDALLRTGLLVRC
ncbi:hypothetical protein GCM10027432_21990 [Lysobacter fragariae]